MDLRGNRHFVIDWGRLGNIGVHELASSH